MTKKKKGKLEAEVDFCFLFKRLYFQYRQSKKDIMTQITC